MAAQAAYTLRELLRDASMHALPVGPDSGEASRAKEVLEAARLHADPPEELGSGLQNPAPLPSTLLRVETLAKVIEALGLIVASRVSEAASAAKPTGNGQPPRASRRDSARCTPARGHRATSCGMFVCPGHEPVAKSPRRGSWGTGRPSTPPAPAVPAPASDCTHSRIAADHPFPALSQLAEGHAVRIKGFALFFLRRFGHGIRLPQFREAACWRGCSALRPAAGVCQAERPSRAERRRHACARLPFRRRA